jgi:hypothetical protein
MRNFLLLFTFSLFFVFPSISQGQTIYKFSNRYDKFPKELQEFMGVNLEKERQKELKEFLEIFTTFWMSDSLNDNQKKSVIADANTMSAKRLRPYPHFDAYLKTIIQMGRNPKALLRFDEWMSSLQPLLKSKSSTNFLTYLEKTIDLFSKNQIFASEAVIWEVSSLDFVLKFDDKNPIYEFNTVNLKCTTRKDSTVIFQTQGKLDLITGQWEGIGGRIDWRRAQLDTSKVYANLRNYSIRLNSAKFFADSVTFYDHRRFGFAIPGYLSEKVLTSPPTEAIFPSFISYRKDLEINEIFKDVDYRGGYSLKGAQIIGSGDKDQKAYFIFKRRGKRLVWAGAESFQILPDRINSERVNVKIFLENDSIYHPGLSMTYLDKKRVLNIFRLDQGLSMAPFFDTYHQLDLYTESMIWKLDEDSIDMKMIQEEGSTSQAYFESLNFFSKARYDRIQGIDNINPVLALYQFVENRGFNEFYVEDFVNYMKLSPEVVITILMKLATQGFLIYDVNDDYCIVKDRVETYVKAERGKVDYDVIRFNSSVKSIPNASINLFNNDLVIQGVDMVFLSDSQKVYIYPKNQRVVVKKNRDFTFDGKIMAGRFDLYAKECYFEYDKFKLRLPIIDSLSFKVMAFEENKWGEKPQIRVKTVIEDLKGDILVDDPGNKSGRKDFPQYPILNSETNSFVYYDKREIFNGVYKRDKFYYRLERFSIDSLDNFQTEGLEFKGYLASAGIFPDIVQPLKVQPDYSLGFQKETGPAGLNIYGNKGNYVAKISLSNLGLRGDGDLKYLTSISKSKDFKFFPDSTSSILDSYVINERKTGVEYPSVNAENVKMLWTPYKDLMVVKDYKEENPIRMYDNEAALSGNLFLTPNNLTGSGKIAIKDAEMDAKLFKFKNIYYNTDSCDFRLKKFVDESMGLGGLSSDNQDAYSTSNFKARVDFKLRKGEFEANGGEKRVDFPENMYYCYMDQFVWYMDKEETEFSSTAKRPEGFDKLSDEDKIDVDIQGSEFTSTHPAQDSLQFVATRAIFNRKNALIHAFGVEYIRVADAAIIPDKKELNIYRKAEIDELTNAKIIANAITKYYKLYNATAKIDGRRTYHGRGLYDYKDETGVISNIYFTNIYVDTTGTTIGEGDIAESAKFSLSPAFDFMGRSKLIANIPNLYFSGGTRIHYDCDTLPRNWMFFNAFINPTDVAIPIDTNIKNTTNNRLFAGIYQNQRGSDVFHSFLDPVSSSSRNPIASAVGVLKYDKVSQEYRISTEDKLKQLSLLDNYLSLSKRGCDMKAEGLIRMAMEPGPVTMNTYGTARYFIPNDSAVFYVSIPLNFFFSEKALEIMTTDLNNQMDADAVNLDSRAFNLALGQIFGNAEAEKLMTEITTQGGAFKRIPKEIQSTILISDVEMKYNSLRRSFVSTGKIGIASIDKTQVNKYFTGKIEIQNKGSYTEMRLVIDLGGGSYYYFEYNSSSGNMLAFTTNAEFIKVIEETKPEDRKMKSKEEGKTIKYVFGIGTAVSYKKFMRQLEMSGEEVD